MPVYSSYPGVNLKAPNFKLNGSSFFSGFSNPPGVYNPPAVPSVAAQRAHYPGSGHAGSLGYQAQAVTADKGLELIAGRGWQVHWQVCSVVP